MTTSQVTGIGWKRGVEDRYPSTMDASLKYGPYNITKAVSPDPDILSGYVCGIREGTGNQVVLANGGNFRGIFFTEYSAELDEKAGGGPPAVITGPALLFIRSRALDPTAKYVASGTGSYLTSSNGKLVPAGATPAAGSVVGKCQEVLADGILVRLNTPTV